MIAFSKYKQLLGKEAEHMSDEEIRQLRDTQYRAARLAFEKWQKKRLGVLPVVDDQA